LHDQTLDGKPFQPKKRNFWQLAVSSLVGFCPKNLAFVRKIMALPESGGLQAPAPGSYGAGTALSVTASRSSEVEFGEGPCHSP